MAIVVILVSAERCIRQLWLSSIILHNVTSTACTTILIPFFLNIYICVQYNALPMNCPQINFGEIGSEEEVDIWHLDSVPYVLVILLSDATDMVGGELRVARLPDPKEALKQVRIIQSRSRRTVATSYSSPSSYVCA